MRATIIEPAGVVELVRRVLVMSHVASVFAFRPTVARADATDSDQPAAVGRPAKGAHAILEICKPFGFATAHGQQIDLSAQWLSSSGAGRSLNGSFSRWA